MKVLFTTDLHGRRWKYERLLETAQRLGVDAVLNGGDMLPHAQDLFGQGRFIRGYLDAHLARFDAAGIYYLGYLGNDDLGIFDALFDETCEKYPFVTCLAQRRFQIGDWEFVGMNWVVDYPFRLKDRCRMDTRDYVFQEQFGTGLLSTPGGLKEIADWFAYARALPTLADELERLVRPKDMARAVYVIHMPPHNLGLDECRAGPKVGSKAVYDFLLEHQPRLSLHGHIHESPQVSGKWYARLGDTLCIQPGQLESLTYVVIDLETMEFDRHTEKP
jgi:Icc-related predicted phosphoesterase